MKEQNLKILVSMPPSLLKKLDRLAKKSNQDRSAFICTTLDKKIFADEMKEANREA
jgi:metal-responsive CopG/Arc/MetJ family transcriptional regulator